MPRFVFRLDVPLRLARARRDTLRRELAHAMRELAAAEEQLATAEARLQQIGVELLRREMEGIPGAELHSLSAGRDAARSRLPALRGRRRELAERETRIRADLAHATREVTVYEKVRRAAFVSWRRELQRKEQAAIDDVMLVRRVRAMALARGEQP